MVALVVLSGLPAAGKTTFAAAFATRFGAAVLESDRVRRELFPERRYTSAENARVFAEIRERAAARLCEGGTVVIDATNVSRRDRSGFERLAQEHGARYVTVRLTTPESLLRERLAAPRSGASEAGVAVYERMRDRCEPFSTPCVHVDSRYDLDPSLALVDALSRGTGAQTAPVQPA